MPSFGTPTTGNTRTGTSNANWTTLRNAGSANADSAAISAHARFSGIYIIYRSTIPFNTSTIPVSAVVTSAKLALAANGVGGSGRITNVVSTTVTNASMSNTDYAIGKYGSAALGSFKQTPSVNEICEATLDTSLITRGGTTRVGLRADLDVSNTVPTDADYIDWYPRNASTVGYRPLLTVEYTEAASYAYSPFQSGVINSNRVVRRSA